MKSEEVTCMSGHTFSELKEILDFMYKSELSIEIFDAFLMEYGQNKNIQNALSFARSEWDC